MAFRKAFRLDVTERRHPESRRHPNRKRRHWRDRRVLRIRCRLHLVHGNGHDLQHGRRNRSHHVRLPVQQAHERLPRRHSTQGRRIRSEQVPEVSADRGFGLSVRPGDRNQPGHVGASCEWAVYARFGLADKQVGRQRQEERLARRYQSRSDRVVHEQFVRGHGSLREYREGSHEARAEVEDSVQRDARVRTDSSHDRA